jgi:uncharacterized protein YfiM (DUF2279 family)
VFRLFVLLVIVSIAAVALAGWLALSPTPSVSSAAPLSHEDIARAERIIRNNDPRRLPGDAIGTVRLSSRDLELVAGYIARKAVGASSRIQLARDRLIIDLSRALPVTAVDRYLNLEVRLRGVDRALAVEAVRLGRLTIPPSLARLAIETLLRQTGASEQMMLAVESLQDIEITEDLLKLRYRWHPDLIDGARNTLLADVDREALRHYHDRLVGLQRQGVGRRGELSAILQPLFADAMARSANADPAIENAALLSLLGSWSSGRGLSHLIPGDLERPSRFRLTLRGRRDYAQHFLISAAIAARGDSTLSNAVGVFKEIVDTDRGTGFSFTDIAADMAGSRFGELAVTPDAAAGLQRRIAQGVTDSDLLPQIDDLPEFMDTNEFEQRFERVGSASYDAMMQEIQQRLAALPLLAHP